jgi:hypothetical protein
MIVSRDVCWIDEIKAHEDDWQMICRRMFRVMVEMAKQVGRQEMFIQIFSICAKQKKSLTS